MHARARFLRGFAALLPLWVGAIPVGVAYAVAARAAGLGGAETQLMSLTVFSAAAQVSAVALLATGTPWAVLVGTAAALNAQALLLGLATARRVHPAGVQRLVAAWFLTDGAYGITAAGRRFTLAGLLGAGVSMYVAWNGGTALGLIAGHTLAPSRRLGLDFVAPLTFLAVLMPLVRTRAALCAVLVAGATVLGLMRLVPGGIAVLGAGFAGSAAGAAWQQRLSVGRGAAVADGTPAEAER